jgi:hypothetical protein
MLLLLYCGGITWNPQTLKLKLSVLNLSQRLFTPRTCTPRISGATYSDCQRYPSTTSGVPSNN